MSLASPGQTLAATQHATSTDEDRQSQKDVIRLENVTKTYHMGEVDVPVLRGVSLTIARGEMVALMGASGSGKTTLMNILGCLDRPTSGEYWLDDRAMSGLSPDSRALVRTDKLGFVFQSFNLLPRTSALKNVLMPLHYAVHRTPRTESRDAASALLKRVGLETRIDHEPSQMSGGQQQRVAIARSLVNGPLILLADEPTGNLDSHTGDAILRMFQRLNDQGLTVIIVTHDPKVAGYAHRTITIADGRIANDTGHAEMPAVVDGEPHVASRANNAVQGRGLNCKRNWALPSAMRGAILSLRRHLMRSILTTLGLVIGIASVIAMTEIGEGSKKAIEKTIASMGAFKLPVFPGSADNGGVRQGSGTRQSLTAADVDAISLQCPDVRAATAMVWSRAQISYERVGAVEHRKR